MRLLTSSIRKAMLGRGRSRLRRSVSSFGAHLASACPQRMSRSAIGRSALAELVADLAERELGEVACFLGGYAAPVVRRRKPARCDLLDAPGGLAAMLC